MLPRLHAVTNDSVLELPDLYARADGIAASGLVAIHARARTAPARRLVDVARRFAASGAQVFVNDRVDVVRHVGARGVHLPARSMPTAAARQVLGPDVLIGRSAHDPVEAQGACAAGADYVFLGPIWETASHPGHPGLGVEAIRAAHPATVIAIGGVTPDRVDACLDRGAYGVAAIAALWYAADPHAAAANMLISLGQTPVTPGGVSGTESPSGHSGMAPTITVTVNGQARTLQPQISLLEMLEQLELDPRTVVVELNLEIVRRPALGETALQDGDRVELVHFVGGG